MLPPEHAAATTLISAPNLILSCMISKPVWHKLRALAGCRFTRKTGAICMISAGSRLHTVWALNPLGENWGNDPADRLGAFPEVRAATPRAVW
jgi:hypothetical protein